MMRLNPIPLILAGAVTSLITLTASAQPVQIGDVPCVSPPALHCPDADCPNDLVAHRGNVLLPKNNRPFFLDYPCDLKPGERVTFILSLHGGGMIGNWHRHYFPLVDLKDKYRLVIATPSAVKVLWDPANDDAHLRNIVSFVYAQLGANNIKAFWLAGHSNGGVTALRLLRTPFFATGSRGGSASLVVDWAHHAPTCLSTLRRHRIWYPSATGYALA